MTKKNLPTKFNETNSNRWNRRSLIGHRRTANSLLLTSLSKNAVQTFKNLISIKASNSRILPEKNGLPIKILKFRTISSSNQPTKDGAVVVWRTDLYKREAFRQLADTKFYAKVNKDLTLANQKNCQRYCQQTHFRRKTSLYFPQPFRHCT